MNNQNDCRICPQKCTLETPTLNRAQFPRELQNYLCYPSTMARHTDRIEAVFIFDPDCGFCNKYVAFVSSFPSFALSARPVPYNEANLSRFGLNERQCQQAAQWVLETGTVRAGSDAIAESLIATRSPILSIVGRIIRAGVVRPFFQAGYRWVARHRALMPGGSSQCNVPSSRSASISAPPIQENGAR